ncbi:hypothetical protein EDEG_03436 [Edhazardia aedis USNM 41457]|uniref:Uncharacterized protein n=1 Tax=Edhazardia aedis (strain USNM 41457) TaxID=1003232 RepID=J8ZR12_EDHAE|nr:hypothetical protein EDEG_03436 [Edhazardia aedis USNM 41457]|eukprot:EJW02118.1 hypothetical protein EDEG_03436 [Edhazardia aedis USNM 41457]
MASKISKPFRKSKNSRKTTNSKNCHDTMQIMDNKDLSVDRNSDIDSICDSCSIRTNFSEISDKDSDIYNVTVEDQLENIKINETTRKCPNLSIKSSDILLQPNLKIETVKKPSHKLVTNEETFISGKKVQFASIMKTQYFERPLNFGSQTEVGFYAETYAKNVPKSEFDMNYSAGSNRNVDTEEKTVASNDVDIVQNKNSSESEMSEEEYLILIQQHRRRIEDKEDVPMTSL